MPFLCVWYLLVSFENKVNSSVIRLGVKRVLLYVILPNTTIKQDNNICPIKPLHFTYSPFNSKINVLNIFVFCPYRYIKMWDIVSEGFL